MPGQMFNLSPFPQAISAFSFKSNASCRGNVANHSCYNFFSIYVFHDFTDVSQGKRLHCDIYNNKAFLIMTQCFVSVNPTVTVKETDVHLFLVVGLFSTLCPGAQTPWRPCLFFLVSRSSRRWPIMGTGNRIMLSATTKGICTKIRQPIPLGATGLSGRTWVGVFAERCTYTLGFKVIDMK